MSPATSEIVDHPNRKVSQPERHEIELSILMPCLNEAETIAACIVKAASFLRNSQIIGEILIADNGSIDGSQSIAVGLGARVIAVAQRGYGAALLGGIEAARGKYVIMADADGSYDFENLSPFIEKLRAGTDLVMGNRFAGGIAPGAMPPLHRYLGNPVLSFIGRLFFKVPIRDFHCGLRGFETTAIRELGLTTTGMEFATEMVVCVALAGLRIAEVATTLNVDGRSRAPHLRTWRDGWRHLKFLLMYSPRWLFLFPGTALLALGLLGTASLLWGPISLGNVALDLNTLAASCFAVVVGTQFLTFGAIVRIFAAKAGVLTRIPRDEFLINWISTDHLVQIAALLLAAGIGGAGWATSRWAAVGFGSLNLQIVPRVLIVSLAMIVVAIQTAASAFLFGVLEIPLRRAK